MKSAMETWLSKFRSPTFAIVIEVLAVEKKPAESVARNEMEDVPAGKFFEKKTGVAPISSPLPAGEPVSPKIPSLSRSHENDIVSAGSGSDEAVALSWTEEPMPTV